MCFGAQLVIQGHKFVQAKALLQSEKFFTPDLNQVEQLLVDGAGQAVLGLASVLQSKLFKQRSQAQWHQAHTSATVCNCAMNSFSPRQRRKVIPQFFERDSAKWIDKSCVCRLLDPTRNFKTVTTSFILYKAGMSCVGARVRCPAGGRRVDKCGSNVLLHIEGLDLVRDRDERPPIRFVPILGGGVVDQFIQASCNESCCWGVSE